MPSFEQFCRLDRLGLTVTQAEVLPDHAVLVCAPTTEPGTCPGCDQPGSRYDTVLRRLTHVPFGWRPTLLQVQTPRYRCVPCRRVWRHDLRPAAPSQGRLSRDAVLHVAKQIVIDRVAVSHAARNVGVGWNTAHAAILTAAREWLDAPDRLDGVSTIGVDEHCWRHTRRGDKYVTVVIDLTPVRNQTGPSRLIAVVEGRSTAAFQTWLDAQTPGFRDGVSVVAMDGFAGYKTATTTAIPAAVTVMDPFHVVALAGEKLDLCRQRIQQLTLGHRGRSGDPLYGIRRVARTHAGLLTEKQQHRLARVFADQAHTPFEVTWNVYQTIIDAYRADHPSVGKQTMTDLIDKIKSGVPAGLDEVRTLGRTLHRRRDDILAYFDNPRTSNGPTEAVNGLLEHLRGTARGFRNLTNYVARCLLDAGGFRPFIHSLL